MANEQQLREALKNLLTAIQETPATDEAQAEQQNARISLAVLRAESLVSSWDAQQPATPNVDVRTILLAIVPGDGNGEEVYAESVDDVVAKMTELSEREESLRTQVDLLTAAVEARGREIAKLKATTEPVADGVPDGVHWFTVTQDGMPDFGEEVIGGFWYTDPWLKPDCATRFMWGQCRVVKDDHRDFKDGKRWQTFGPSHNDITHWARLKSPAHHTANHESQNDE